jgi:hypothetical protein
VERGPAQPYRLLPSSDRLAAIADLGIGTQQAWTGGTQTRFHGYFLADTYLAAALTPGLEANLNMRVLNPSASDGYRLSSMVVPGFALHARYPLPFLSVGGQPVRLDVLGTDLGWITVGRGLLLPAGRTSRAAALLRVDYMNRHSSRVALHAGYQMRVYRQGFGPHDEFIAPAWRFNTPQQQDVYVTNPIEYYYLTHDFDVWSHTLMLEARLLVTRQFEFFGDGEEWLRVAILRTLAGDVVDASNFRPPGKKLELFYRAGLRFFPWKGQRRRASLFVTNKQIAAGAAVTDPVFERFNPNTPLWCVTLDGFL